VIFTGSATESNNLALRGSVRKSPRPRLIISAIEHKSVLETARDLERDGMEVVYLPVDKNGVVDLKKIEDSLDENTISVSVMYGNNVTGVIQPIAEIANMIRNFKISSPVFHTDAVQAFQYLNCNVDDLGVNMMTLSSHKIYGPKGAGLLFVRKHEKNIQLPITNYQLQPITTGGGQEFGLRSGTENVPAIVGFAKAMEEAIKIREKESKRVEKLKELLWREIKKKAPEAIRNGEGAKTLPHILNVAFPNASKNLVARLDALGLAVSAGAACSTRSQEASYVLTAMGIPKELARRSIRFSLGRGTTKTEIQKAAKAVRQALA
ncbi:MAG: cysteine desulfurase family protein, partial [Patescibacteria group bacterium]